MTSEKITYNVDPKSGKAVGKVIAEKRAFTGGSFFTRAERSAAFYHAESGFLFYGSYKLDQTRVGTRFLEAAALKVLAQ